tara:strand:+ start:783 stop:1082 length:300 start_codon:yes stop_codon:yes gene_type:complete
MTNQKITKARNQVKSKFYYIFWGVATVSVFAGQIYVGSGYRQMSRSFNRILDAVRFELIGPDPYDHPMYVPRSEIPDMIDSWEREDALYHPTNPLTPIY